METAEITKTINDAESKRLTAWIIELEEQTKKRDEEISVKKKRMNDLQEAVEEFEDLHNEINEMRAEQKEQNKLLKTLIDFAEKSSGIKYENNGPLFQE